VQGDPDQLQDVARLLRERLKQEPRSTGTGVSVTRSFKHPLELASGVRFEDLVKQYASSHPDSAVTAPLPAGPGTSPEALVRRRAEMERMRLQGAEVTAIITGPGWSKCVIAGHRLTIGDAYPGTGYRITAITSHAVQLEKDDETVHKRLKSIGAGVPRAKKGESR
jgi:hypothetical protein